MADFGELTLDISVNRASGKGGRLFDFGTGREECFYLAIEGRDGKPTLTAIHAGKRQSLTTSDAIPADQWARVRVEMDGSTASIYMDGKQVAKKEFAFRPRDVFIGDLPEGNFIACARDKKEFFKGRMDHFRIYRQVHKDIDALGPVPFALTQMQEWSEKDQQLADEWDGRRKAKEAELNAGRYGEIQTEIRRVEKQKSDLQAAAGDETKRTEQNKKGEVAALAARIEALQKESRILLDNALKDARLFGENPYPGKEAAELKNIQQEAVYHATADWEDRTPEEVAGIDPPKMRKWLKKVRGY